MQRSVGLDLATWLRTRGPLAPGEALTVVEQLAAELDATAGPRASVAPEQVLVEGLDGTGPISARLAGPPAAGTVSTPHSLAELLREAVTGGAPEAPAGVERVVTWARDGAYADATGMVAAARAALAATPSSGTQARSAGDADRGRDHRVTRVMTVPPAETYVRPADDEPAARPAASASDHRVTRVMTVPPSDEAPAAARPQPSETLVRPAGEPARPAPSETLVRPAGEPATGAARPAPSETLVRPAGEPATGASRPLPSETLVRPAGESATGTSRPAPSETLVRPAGEPATGTTSPHPSETLARPAGESATGTYRTGAPAPSETLARPADDRSPAPPAHPADGEEPGPDADGPRAAATPAPQQSPGAATSTTPSWAATTRATAAPPKPRRRRGPLFAVLAVLLLVAAAVAVYLWPASAPLQVTGAAVTVTDPAPRCDATVRVVGTIRTNAQDGDVTYRWVRSDGTTSPAMTQSVTAGSGSVDVPLLWTVTGPGRFPGTATLEVLDPNPVQARGSFTYTC